MRVLIIGGGFCGTTVAKKLDGNKELDITLFDHKDYFEYTPSIHKILYEPSYYSKITIPFKKILKRTKIVTKPITDVNEKVVKTKGKKYNFDILVIATGIDYPIFLENKKNVFVLKTSEDAKKLSKALKKAKSVCLIGGGLIGTEIAGEIATKSPKKKLTVIHSRDRLIERNTPRASKYAQKFLEKNNVEMLFNEKVICHEGKQFITESGKKITADIGIWCAGIKCNPYFMKHHPEEVFSKRRALEVDEHLQLLYHKNIFVGGDINGVAEEKTAQNAERQGELIAKNIIQKINREKLYKYKPRSGPLIISLGDKYAVAAFGKLNFNGRIPGFLKHLIEYWVMHHTRH